MWEGAANASKELEAAWPQAKLKGCSSTQNQEKRQQPSTLYFVLTHQALSLR
jgi:hypothetical protein